MRRHERGFTPLIIIFLVLIVAVFGVFIYKSGKFSTIADKLPQTQQESPLFDGKLERLPEDLGILSSEFDKDNNFQPYNIYYKAGTFTRGKYKGFTRIVLITTRDAPYSQDYFLATQDSKKYILFLDEQQKGYNDTPEKMKDNGFDPDKISGIETQDIDGQVSLKLDSNFGLYREQFYTSSEDLPVAVAKKVKYPYSIRVLSTDRSGLTELKSNISGYQIFQENIVASSPNPSATEKDKYLDGRTEVIAFDNTGLGYSYSLATEKNINEFTAKNAQYNKEMNEYNKTVAARDAKVSELQSQGMSYEDAVTKADEISPYGKYPEYPSYPNLAFTKADLTTNEPNLYDTYGGAFPGACGSDVNTYLVKGLTENDLTITGSMSGIDIYTLKDPKHPLNQSEFDSKMGYAQQDPKGFIEYANPGKTIPTYDEYVSKHPLLFAKDYWGRWYVLGEYDWKLPGGCGKPVVYLYPQKTTKISLKFTKQMDLDVAIPSYRNGWNVIAEPNGVLHNQVPENCSNINSAHFGSEYAAQACLTNSYPYIYWAGQSSNKYPKVNGGWVVAQDNLASFMNDKLDSVGFTKTERSDMLSYWLPKMLEKDSTYYRISFLNTQQLNELFPMVVSPRPESLYRIFLDWQPLNAPESISPQNLPKIQRNGFFMLEWGGLNR